MRNNSSVSAYQMQEIPKGLAITTISPKIRSSTPDAIDPLLQVSFTSGVISKSIGPKRRKWYEKLEVKVDAELRLMAGFYEWFLILVREVLPMVGLIVAVVFASKSTVFRFANATVINLTADADLQLALIGFLNKVLDVIVQASLKHTASILLTAWMACGYKGSGKPGVNLLDFELKDELVQPWTCIINFQKRCDRLGRGNIGWRGILRFIVTLAISVCVLLLALSVNTLGVPKKRWYPNSPDNGWPNPSGTQRDALTIYTPRMVLNGIDWVNNWEFGVDLVGSSEQTGAVAIGFAAASTFTVLKGLPGAYRSQPSGWTPLSNEEPGLITALDTVVNGSTVRGVSVQNTQVRGVFNYLQAHSSKEHHKAAFGWKAIVNITAPVLTTICSPGLPPNMSVPIGTIPVQLPLNSSTFTILIRAIPLLNFAGVTCNMTLQQALFPVGSWIVDNAPDAEVSINNYGINMNTVPYLLDPSLGDSDCAHQLAIGIGATVGSMNGLTPAGLVYEVVLMARRLNVINENLSPVNDTAGMTAVIATIAQHLFSIAAWNMTAFPDPTRLTTSYPVRWQVYGSGPRLPWEWATATVDIVILFSLLCGAVLKMMWRIQAGPWLEVGGMMLVANESGPMHSVKGSCAGEASERAKKGIYYLRDAGTRGVELTDQGNEGFPLEKGRTYKSRNPRLVFSIQE